MIAAAFVEPDIRKIIEIGLSEIPKATRLTEAVERVIGEIGAGRGRYTVHLARRVGPAGKVYANDISESALSYLRDRCRRDNIENIEIILGEELDPLLPEKALDMVIMVFLGQARRRQ